MRYKSALSLSLCTQFVSRETRELVIEALQNVCVYVLIDGKKLSEKERN